MSMFDKILKEIKPTDKEKLEINNKVNEFLILLDKVNLKYTVGGSYSKNTWLTGKHDVDIFILYEDDKGISDKLDKSLKKYERIHGSRDYFLINYKYLEFELVPVLNINNYKQAKNITDVSQLHVKWVKEHISRLSDDVRLAKQFCKANRVYGAETYIKGFHGYLLEILVIHYGSFLSFVKNASKWNECEFIDPNNHSEFKSEQKFPLTVIDPVQPNRNVASALSFENFNLFVSICNKFLKNKGLSYFKEKKINIKKYNLVLKAEPLNGNRDVVGTKMLKIFEKIKYELNSYGFEVKDSIWFWDRCGYFCFKVKKKLSKFEKVYGPPVTNKEHVAAFKQKHLKCKFGEEKGKVFVIKAREYTDVRKFVKELIKDENIKNRVKKIVL